uniref:Uncharacterized protein n=1 Tax=Clastoptera arizonana TaxID=38151 RepID=A0A1B6C334_9HEMI
MNSITEVVKRGKIKMAPHSKINMILYNMKRMEHLQKELMKVQGEMIDDIKKWAMEETNQGVNNLMQNFVDLNNQTMESGNRFAGKLKNIRCDFKTVLNKKKDVDKIKKNISKLENKVNKTEKILLKSETKGDIGTMIDTIKKDIKDNKDKLKDNTIEKEELNVKCLKLILINLSDGFLEYADNINCIYESNKAIANIIPDKFEKGIGYVKYTAEENYPSLEVKRAVNRINAYTCRPAAPSFPHHDHSPPPPYRSPQQAFQYSPENSGTPRSIGFQNNK